MRPRRKSGGGGTDLGQIFDRFFVDLPETVDRLFTDFSQIIHRC